MTDMMARHASGDVRLLLVIHESDPRRESGPPLDLSAMPAVQGEAHRLTATTWLLRTTASARHVLQELTRHMAQGDRLVVAEAVRVGWHNVEAGADLFDELVRLFENHPPD